MKRPELSWEQDVAYLTGCLHALLEDARRYYPGLSKDLLRDQQRISTLSSTRGIPFFANDLPNLDKLLLAALEKGQYCSHGEALTRPRHRRGIIPLWLEGLYLLVFSRDGMLKAEPDPVAIGFLHQIFLINKKLKLTHRKEQIDEKLIEFAEVESSLPSSTSDVWEDPTTDSVGDLHCRDLDDRLRGQLEHNRGSTDRVTDDDIRYWNDIVQQTFDVIACTLGQYDPYENHFRHGPGAVSDGGSQDYKYENLTWDSKLESVFPMADFAYANYNHWIDSINSSTTKVGWDEHPYSKLIAVPKDYKGPRLIAAEPTAHQWCQQNIRDFLAIRCSNTWLTKFIDFADQSRNGELALLASHTGSHVTADLSSASDCVSCYLVERAFRKNPGLLRALAASRTPILKQNLSTCIDSEHKLKKFAAMGSACTFPVESLIFFGLSAAAIAISERRTHITERYLSNLNQFNSETQDWDRKLLVYGDDIIIDKKAWVILEPLLDSYYFRINRNKTFSTGKFRESCGVDAYNGVNISPCRINSVLHPKKPETYLAALDSSNNFHMRGLWKTAETLKDAINQLVYLPVGRVSSGQSVYKSFTGEQVENTYYHSESCNWRVRCATFISRCTKQAQTGLACLLQWATENPPQDLMWASGRNMRPRLKLNRKGHLNIVDLK